MMTLDASTCPEPAPAIRDHLVISAGVATASPEEPAVAKAPLTWGDVAEGGGFEPPRGVNPYPLSRRAH